MAQSVTRVSGYLTAPAGALFGGLIALDIVLLFAVSGYVLIEAGWNYGDAGGSPLEKIHPATMLAALILLLTAMTAANPLVPLARGLGERPRVVFYLATVFLMMAQAMLVVGLPFTVFIDTFIGPVLVFLFLAEVDEDRRRRLAWLIHGLFVVNSLLGIAEVGLGFRLTPLHIEGETLEEEWRASAFIGHPLSNAMLTGSYMVLLLSGGARDLPQFLKPGLFLIAAAGMVVFGGRAATGLVVLFVVWHVLRRLVDVLRGRPFDAALVLLGLIGLPVLAGGVLVLADAGFFDKFLSRLVDDQGSASTRVEMFEIFKHLTWAEILLGPNAEYVHNLMRHYGLDYGIESFWVAIVLSYGLIAGLVFFAGLFMFCAEVVKERPASLAVMIYFFAVASASLSLSAKTHGFSMFIVMILVLLPRGRAQEAAEVPSAPNAGQRAGRARLQVA
jgi:hypothetical protein